MLIKILILCSALNSGDVGYSKSVVDAISNIPNVKIEKYLIDASKPTETINEQYKNIETKIGNEKHIVFAVGERGMEALGNINKFKKIDSALSYNALGIHQYFNKISELSLNYIAIPEATLDSIVKKNVIEKINDKTLTFAVPSSNPTTQILKESYENWSADDKPVLNSKYIIVMLPGDAPDHNNVMQYYTKESNKILFNNVSSLWKSLGENYKIIVQNGPRTGKHDPITGNVVGTHEYDKGSDPKKAIDEISKDFIDSLKEASIPYAFFNFTFEIDGEKKKAISVFNQLLYLAQNSNSYFVLPSESVSMLGQLPLFLDSDRIIAFKPSSMNSDHEKIFNLAVKKSYISYFNNNNEVIYAKKSAERKNDDAVDVAKQLIEGYNRFLKK